MGLNTSFVGRNVVSTMLLLYDLMTYFPSETLISTLVFVCLKLMNLRFAFWANVIVVKNRMSTNFFMVISYFLLLDVALGTEVENLFAVQR